jgi:hypothetical protein
VAQSEDPEDFLAPAANRVRAGTLLLANTDLFEPTFRRSVIYIVEHNDGGTLGVVLNRPSETAIYNVLPQWTDLAAKPKSMFIGGPVKRDAALCLGTLRVGADPEGVEGLRHVAGRIVMVDLDADPEMIATLVDGSEYTPGIERELAVGHHLAARDRCTMQHDAIAAGRELEVVAYMHCRYQETQVAGQLAVFVQSGVGLGDDVLAFFDGRQVVDVHRHFAFNHTAVRGFNETVLVQASVQGQ